MPGFFTNLLQVLRGQRGRDMGFLCRHLLSERGEASQTALAQEIINTYAMMDAPRRLEFFEMLCTEFSPNPAAILGAAAVRVAALEFVWFLHFGGLFRSWA